MKEMTDHETQSVNGGVFGLLFLEAVAAGIIIGAGVNIIDNWNDFKAGLAGKMDPSLV
jgi:bacteriocin-like protein